MAVPTTFRKFAVLEITVSDSRFIERAGDTVANSVAPAAVPKLKLFSISVCPIRGRKLPVAISVTEGLENCIPVLVYVVAPAMARLPVMGSLCAGRTNETTANAATSAIFFMDSPPQVVPFCSSPYLPPHDASIGCIRALYLKTGAGSDVYRVRHSATDAVGVRIKDARVGTHISCVHGCGAAGQRDLALIVGNASRQAGVEIVGGHIWGHETMQQLLPPAHHFRLRNSGARRNVYHERFPLIQGHAAVAPQIDTHLLSCRTIGLQHFRHTHYNVPPIIDKLRIVWTGAGVVAGGDANQTIGRADKVMGTGAVFYGHRARPRARRVPALGRRVRPHSEQDHVSHRWSESDQRPDIDGRSSNWPVKRCCGSRTVWRFCRRGRQGTGSQRPCR